MRINNANNGDERCETYELQQTNNAKMEREETNNSASESEKKCNEMKQKEENTGKEEIGNGKASECINEIFERSEPIFRTKDITSSTADKTNILEDNKNMGTPKKENDYIDIRVYENKEQINNASNKSSDFNDSNDTTKENGSNMILENYNKLLNEKEELSKMLESMKKDKMQLLAKFKAYTINNKKENENLKKLCEVKEEEIGKLTKEIKMKEEQVIYMEEKVKEMEDIMIEKKEKNEQIESKMEQKWEEAKQIEERMKQIEQLVIDKEEKIKQLQSEISVKEKEMEKYNAEHYTKMNEYKNLLKKQEEEKTYLIKKNEEYIEMNKKLQNEINKHIEDIKKTVEENKYLKLEITKTEETLKMTREELEKEQKKEKDIATFDIKDKDIFFVISVDINTKLVCFQKDSEFYILPENVFDSYYPNIKKPIETDKLYEEKLKQYTEMTNSHIKALEEEKTKREKEYVEYKNKVQNMIEECNNHYKIEEEKNQLVQELNNKILKYEEDLSNYKNETSKNIEKIKKLEQEICKEKSLREQQNVAIADYKKKIKKERIELEKIYNEKNEKETEKKINEMKEIFQNKEKMLQEKIDSLLYKIEKLTFFNEEKKQTFENVENSYKEGETEKSNRNVYKKNSNENSNDLAEDEKKDRSVDTSKLKIFKDITDDKVTKKDDIICDKCKSNITVCNNVINDNNSNSGSSCSNVRNIPVYPTEYKMIRKKLETYELVIEEEKEKKKALVEEIDSLKNQIKNYESVSGNFERIAYQKNILINLISQIPAKIPIDAYAMIVYNSFNFTNEEKEQINMRRSKK